MPRFYAQGDVVFVPVSALPGSLVPVPPMDGRLIFAYGEVTGHHHSIPAAEGVALLEAPGLLPHRYLTIAELIGEVGVEHQEHGTVRLPPGTYEVRRQREATDNDEEWVNVAD